MRLFVANLTKQHHHFLYRVPEDNVPGGFPRHQDIAIGAQVELPGVADRPLSREQIDSIVAHHEHYGMKSVAEASKIKGFTGLVYSLDKPVQLNDEGFLRELLESNDEALTDRANERRETTAAAIDARLREVGTGSGAPLQRMEVEQVEVTEGSPRVAAGIETVAENVSPRNQGSRRR